eukprot:m.48115 g.48115  ORF g.48115 m.48115 type:complete len:1130 (-) comp8899_c0_seq1:59-3448(-)
MSKWTNYPPTVDPGPATDGTNATPMMHKRPATVSTEAAFGSGFASRVDTRRSSSLSDLHQVAFCAVFLRDGSYKTIQVTDTLRTVGSVIQAVLQKVNSNRWAADYRLVGNTNSGAPPVVFESGQSSQELLAPTIDTLSLKLKVELDPAMMEVLRRKLRTRKGKIFGSRKRGSDKRVATEDDLLREKHHAWYASRGMTRQACEAAVLAGHTGDFLVREASPRDGPDAVTLVLMVNDTGTIANFVIEHDADIDCFLWNRLQFPTVREVIDAARDATLEGNFGDSLTLAYPAACGSVMVEDSIGAFGRRPGRHGIARRDDLRQHSAPPIPEPATDAAQCRPRSRTHGADTLPEYQGRSRAYSTGSGGPPPAAPGLHHVHDDDRGALSDDGRPSHWLGASRHSSSASKSQSESEHEQELEIESTTARLTQLMKQREELKGATAAADGPPLTPAAPSHLTRDSRRRSSLLYEEIPALALPVTRGRRHDPARRSAKDALPSIPTRKASLVRLDQLPGLRLAAAAAATTEGEDDSENPRSRIGRRSISDPAATLRHFQAGFESDDSMSSGLDDSGASPATHRRSKPVPRRRARRQSSDGPGGDDLSEPDDWAGLSGTESTGSVEGEGASRTPRGVRASPHRLKKFEGKPPPPPPGDDGQIPSAGRGRGRPVAPAWPLLPPEDDVLQALLAKEAASPSRSSSEGSEGRGSAGTGESTAMPQPKPRPRPRPRQRSHSDDRLLSEGGGHDDDGGGAGISREAAMVTPTSLQWPSQGGAAASLTPTAQRNGSAPPPLDDFVPPPPVFLDGLAGVADSSIDGPSEQLQVPDEDLYMNAGAAAAAALAPEPPLPQPRPKPSREPTSRWDKQAKAGRRVLPPADAQGHRGRHGYPAGAVVEDLYAAPEGTQLRDDDTGVVIDFDGDGGHDGADKLRPPLATEGSGNRLSRDFGSELEEFDSEDSWDQDATLTPGDGLQAAMEEARRPPPVSTKFARSSSLQAKSIVRRIKAAVEQKSDEVAKKSAPPPAAPVAEDLYNVPEMVEQSVPASGKQAPAEELYMTPEAVERGGGEGGGGGGGSGEAGRPVVESQGSAEELYMTPETVERHEPTILPSGWVQAWDKTHQRHYYFNRTSKETCWDIPT